MNPIEHLSLSIVHLLPSDNPLVHSTALVIYTVFERVNIWSAGNTETFPAPSETVYCELFLASFVGVSA